MSTQCNQLADYREVPSPLTGGAELSAACGPVSMCDILTRSENSRFSGIDRLLFAEIEGMEPTLSLREIKHVHGPSTLRPLECVLHPHIW